MAQSDARVVGRPLNTPSAALALLAALPLAALVAAGLLFLTLHAWQLLGFPYPLDYGEGPLLAQVQALERGTPLWRLYGDPGAPPYLVVNYPPVYHLATLALSGIPGLAPLAAGRLVSLLAALGCAAALWALVAGPPATASRPGGVLAAAAPLIVLAFLALPIVREWSALMRVDLLGVCLGLWALVLVQRGSRWAALLLALSLLVKPSLIAAPAAAGLWLLFRDPRRALLLGALTAALGGLVVAALQLASGGWFWLHTVTANANPWQPALAEGFWRDQAAIHWPLWAAGALGALLALLRARAIPAPATPTLLLPVAYTCFGALVAIGVGKVGAYANYFLEFYAGLVWLAALATRPIPAARHRADAPLTALLLALVAGALLRYYPLWSENYVKPYGLIEGERPPRVALGAYGTWRDLQRQHAILATLRQVHGALVEQVRAASGPIFTDVPGIAAQAGGIARLQAFETRQLYDLGRWDQRPLLRDLAAGRVPLVVLDYLGNWLTPEMITLIRHRYAQDGSRGTFDIYRPVDPGRPLELTLDLGAGLRVAGGYLSPPAGAGYSPGEALLLTLELERSGGAAGDAACDAQPTRCELAVTLLTADLQPVAEVARPLLYGALPPAAWGDGGAQHMQPVALPPELPPGAYALAARLRVDGADVTVPQGQAGEAPPAAADLVWIEVGEPGGRLLGEQGYFVPEPLLAAWLAAGGYDGPGDPITPAVPFAGGLQQCFVRACLVLRDGVVERLPLGEIALLGEPGLAPGEAAGGYELGGAFRELWEQHGGLAQLGPPISGELLRGDRVVQYTRYARLERPAGGGLAQLAPLGVEYLRLPGIPYRWP